MAQDQDDYNRRYNAIWSSLVEKIVVKSEEEVTVVFKDGTGMKAE